MAAIVFWGSWSAGVTFVSPDDAVAFPLSQADVWQRWWNGFLTTGKILPTDLVWSGLLGSPHFCRELKYVSAIYLAALALAWFLKGRGLPDLAAYGAGLFLGFSGYWLTLFSAGHAGWFEWMSYGVFAFGLIDRAVVRGNLKYWLLLGLVVAWAGFRQPDLWLLFTALTFAYLVFRLADAKIFPWRKMMAALVVFGLVSLPNFLSLVETVKDREAQIARGETVSSATHADSRDSAAARWEFVTNWSLPATETLEFVWPRLNGDTSCPLTLAINAAKGVRPYTGALGRPMNAAHGNYRQHSLYLGLVTALFALLALTCLKEKDVRFFAVAALVAYLFSLGRYFEPAYRLIFALPAGDLIRCPVKWHHLTELSVAVLAGYGIAKAMTVAAKREKGVWIVAALVLAGGLNLAIEAHRFCAPVDYSAAIAAKCHSNLTVLPRQRFSEPSVAAMVKAGYIRSVAKWPGPFEAYLVQVLEPSKPARPAEPKGAPVALGCLSVLTALAVVAFALRRTETNETESQQKETRS